MSELKFFKALERVALMTFEPFNQHEVFIGYGNEKPISLDDRNALEYVCDMLDIPYDKPDFTEDYSVHSEGYFELKRQLHEKKLIQAHPPDEIKWGDIIINQMLMECDIAPIRRK